MRRIHLFNTLTNKKEDFQPLEGSRVQIYACGPTVYDSSHLGHARMVIVWDVIQRYFRFAGYDVTFVRNITDVDDKIIKRAALTGQRPEQVARKYTYEFWHDMYCLNIMPPDVEPRATEFIAPMVEFVQRLIDRQAAYVADGDVYFDVGSFKEYGKLSKQDLEQLMVGAREQVRSQEELQSKKRNPVDFALWKGASQDELGWDSPWGRGRPGWHLECSTMIQNVLGETIDIHGGGEDLVFPHHENEIAQSESLHGKPLARYWLHNSFVQVSAEKMSKSLGNFSTIQELLKNFSADTIRLFILQTHYRNPIDFTPEGVVAAKQAVSRLVRAASFAPGDDGNNGGQASPIDDDTTGKFVDEFTAAMDNDFNTPQAIASLFALADKIFTAPEKDRAGYAAVLRSHAGVLGLKLDDNRKVIDSSTSEKVMDLVLDLRKSAREKKDYQTSDLIRERLQKLGINVMDVAGGADWEKV